MIKLIRQSVCRHDYSHIGTHMNTNLNLWQCNKCKKFYVQHWGMDIGYECRTPDLSGYKVVLYNNKKYKDR